MAAETSLPVPPFLLLETPALVQRELNPPDSPQESVNPYRAPRSLDEADPSPAGFPRWGWRVIWGLMIFNGLLLGLGHTIHIQLPEPVIIALLYWTIWGIPLSTAASCTWLVLWKRFTPSDVKHRKTVLSLLVSLITVWGLLAFSVIDIIM